MSVKIITGAAWVSVEILLSEGSWAEIGLATGASYDEDFNVQPANCIGHLGPISYDSQGYSCSISIQAFIPETAEALVDSGLGDITLSELLPTRSIVALTGKGQTFNGLRFTNNAVEDSDPSKIIVQFRDVIIASDGGNVQPNQYVTTNVRLMAVERVGDGSITVSSSADSA